MRFRAVAAIAVGVATCLSFGPSARAADDRSGVVTLGALTVHGAVAAIDFGKGVVALIGRDGSALVIVVNDVPDEQAAVTLGTPVVTQYLKALDIEVLSTATSPRRRRRPHHRC